MMNHGLLTVPLLGPRSQNPYLSAGFIRALNVSGSTLGAGDAVILDVTAANHAAGARVPILRTTDNDHRFAAGFVDADESDIPDQAECWIQVAGLHPAAKVNGSIALTPGDWLSTGPTAGVAVKAALPENALAIYVDDAYSTAATATKKVFLVNRLGLQTIRPE